MSTLINKDTRVITGHHSGEGRGPVASLGLGSGLRRNDY